MKVLTKVVMLTATGGVLSSEGFEYDGPVAECKGGVAREAANQGRQAAGIIAAAVERGDEGMARATQRTVNALARQLSPSARRRLEAGYRGELGRRVGRAGGTAIATALNQAEGLRAPRRNLGAGRRSFTGRRRG